MPSANLSDNVSANLGPKTAAQLHPLYELMRPTWEQLAHVREGTGGFLSTGNDSYLVAHPREWLDHTAVTTDPTSTATVVRLNPNPRSPSPKLTARRKLARYENIASAIIEAKKSVLFREQPTRRVGTGPAPKETKPTGISAWWLDVDGDGLNIDDALPQWWDLAATFGHVGLYMDTAAEVEDDGNGAVTTAADQPQPYVRVYTPFDILDWRRDDNGTLVYIKLLEAVQAPVTLETRGVTTYRVRVVDEETWKLYDYKRGTYISQGTHGFGIVPMAFLFAKRRSIIPDFGDSVLGDPRNHIDLFNLTSELRELLRNQTFSFINLPLGTGADAMTVEQAQGMMGQQTGTMNVLFSGGPAQILTGDAANVTAYQEEIQRVKREIYRIAGIQWDDDSKSAQAEGALALKREEMATRVAAYADECQKTEYDLVDLWYRSQYGEEGPDKLEADSIQIHYPEHFQQTPFKDMLDEIAAAQAAGYPASFLKELRKALLSKFEGMSNLDQETLDGLIKDIENAPDDPTPQEQLRQKMELLKAGAQGGGNVGGKPKPNLPAKPLPGEAA